ncbi:hypothetical protein BUE68_12740, partial [Corynebacterium diphtheriae]
LDATAETGIGLVTLTLPDANGYGRIVREQGQIQAIVEHKDASEEQRQILDATAETGIGLVTLTLPDANGYGRIVREQGQI